MKRLIMCMGFVLLSSLASCSGDDDRAQNAQDPLPIDVTKLDPKLDHQEVTIKFSVSKLGGIAQLYIPGKAPTFVIEANSDHKSKDLRVWVEGEFADVLDRLQLSHYGSNPIDKGTLIVATGLLTYSPGVGDRMGHEWYDLNVDKWQNFRIVQPEQSTHSQSKASNQPEISSGILRLPLGTLHISIDDEDRPYKLENLDRRFEAAGLIQFLEAFSAKSKDPISVLVNSRTKRSVEGEEKLNEFLTQLNQKRKAVVVYLPPPTGDDPDHDLKQFEKDFKP
jgi:hypothetical protein